MNSATVARSPISRCRAPFVLQWMYALSFPNFNKLSCLDPPISRYRHCASMDAAEGAGRRTCRNGCTLTHFQILMNSATVTRLFHCADAAGAAMDPAEGAEFRCRAPYMQQWMYSHSFPNFNKLSCGDPHKGS